MNTAKIDISYKNKFNKMVHYIISLDFCAGWDDCNHKHLMAIAKTLFVDYRPIDQARTHLFVALSTLKKKQFVKLLTNEVKEDNPAAHDNANKLLQLTEKIDWVFGDVQFPHSMFKRFLFFRGPQDNFDELDWAQFGIADSLFEQVIESSEVKLLNMFCAVLYRPFGLAYSENRASNWLWFWRRVPLKYKQAMLLNYIGLRKEMILNYPRVFVRREEEEEEEEVKQPTAQADPFGYMKTAYNLAGEKLGTLDQVNRMKINDALLVLTQLDEERENFKTR